MVAPRGAGATRRRKLLLLAVGAAGGRGGGRWRDGISHQLPVPLLLGVVLRAKLFARPLQDAAELLSNDIASCFVLVGVLDKL